MKQYGILAHPAGHSLSPVMHNAAFKALGIDAQYGVFDIPVNEFGDFMQQVRHEPISGLSVSLPYKQDVISHIDTLDEHAARIGAVNTVVNDGSKLYGYNTDWIGVQRALGLDYVEDLKSREADPVAVILGAGGAARAVCYAMLDLGFHVLVVNRTKPKALGIAMDFAEIFPTEITVGEWEGYKTGDVIINATSIWTLDPDKDDVWFTDPDYLKHFEVAMDIGYDPLATPLLDNALELGLYSITGDVMLLEQAMEQFQLWTGKKAPKIVMQDALYDNLFSS